MDLIYMNKSREDVGVMKDYTLDLAFGSGENDFECVIPSGNHCCDEGFFLYIEGTEYGGIIDSIRIDTEFSLLTYMGRTWHGILESKVIEPNAGEGYLVMDGEANEQLAFLVERMGLGALFCVSEEDSGIEVSNYKMNRYIEGYTGIRKMLKASGAKLHISFKNGMVELSAVPLVDYSNDEQFDEDQIDFLVTKHHRPINHVICLGRGELAEREVIHLYADESGNISDVQVFTGLDEVTAKYDFSSVESSEELRQGGIDIIKESWASDEVSISFDSDASVYDIGDIVGAKELTTGIEVAANITKKIVKIQSENITISYKVGE